MKKPDHYLIAAADVQFVDGAVTINRLAHRVRSTRSATASMVQCLGIEVLSQEEQAQRRYRAAVFAVRLNDKDGLVTYEALAAELGLRTATVRRFFGRYPEMKQLWCVRTVAEARVERLRGAVMRLKKAHPGKPVLRKVLAHEVGATETALGIFLWRMSNRHLVAELGIEYTRPGETGRKKRAT